MKRSISLFLIIFLSPLFPKMASTAELLIVEQQGCYYRLEWKDEIGPVYPKTQEGKFAPIKFIDITEVDEIEGLQRDVVFTPTFILFEKKNELARLEGYPGEDFFWALLEIMLEQKTNFKAKTNTERTKH